MTTYSGCTLQSALTTTYTSGIESIPRIPGERAQTPQQIRVDNLGPNRALTCCLETAPPYLLQEILCGTVTYKKKIEQGARGETSD